jgi:hypothetical protein
MWAWARWYGGAVRREWIAFVPGGVFAVLSIYATFQKRPVVWPSWAFWIIALSCLNLAQLRVSWVHIRGSDQVEVTVKGAGERPIRVELGEAPGARGVVVHDEGAE